ncbi:MAG: class I SAM-dependent methyltransferase [Candidatus Omnitrophica bacterium]|nr:class I SAM-dependent methyltransferase [Candidatus Omnitrophota bacterium]MCF7878654.1 class I SAM-dependent methyltransferase [Candidatus Omnitrophota bacterium]MCF7892597.1 class I SAM-dependent methyltransferase [Candidatus Omnitrophota bacterium]
MRNIFDKNSKKYDNWYDKNQFAYLSELELLEKIVPKEKRGLEVGVGTGRFAKELGTEFGIDFSLGMLKIAKKRKIKCVLARGEKLPFKDNFFDYLTIIITICFTEFPAEVLTEAKRVLKKSGKIVVAIIDKNSFLGKFYQAKKSIFYKEATFFSISEISELLKAQGFNNLSFFQTLFNLPNELGQIDKPKEGFGEGGFVTISASSK